jgi:hypothetical protein
VLLSGQVDDFIMIGSLSFGAGGRASQAFWTEDLKVSHKVVGEELLSAVSKDSAKVDW